MINEETKIQINSICFGVYIVLNFIVGAIADFIEVPNLFPILAFSIALFLLFVTKGFNKELFKIKNLLLVLIFVVFFQFALSYLTIESETTGHYFLCFVTIGLSGLFLASLSVDVTKVKHTVILLSVLNVYHFLKMIGSEFTVYTAGDQMGNSYSVLVILFFSLWTFLDKSENLRWRILSLASLILCFALLIKVMTRGPWACVAIFMILLMLKEFRGKKLYFYIFLLIPIIILVLPYVLDVYLKNSTWYYYMFSEKANDVLNGRRTLFETAFVYNGFVKTIIGSGIGSYYSLYNTYPHNFVAQLYFDQGLLGLCVFGKIIVSGIKGVFKEFLNENENAYIVVLLCCASLLRLMISYYFWIDQLFWLLLGLLMKHHYSKMRLSRG